MNQDEYSKTSELQKIYSEIKDDIVNRLEEFEKIWDSYTDEELFAEFVFCLLTPQSKARKCWAAVQKLVFNNVLISSSADEIVQHLVGVRFHNNKTRNIIEAREKFFINGIFVLKKQIDMLDVHQAREYLVENVKGYGFKEASHFLRNIGKGDEISILDRHILRNLVKFGVIPKQPDSISKKVYYEIEARMKKFAKIIQIPLAHLDILRWYKEADEIFK